MPSHIAQTESVLCKVPCNSFCNSPDGISRVLTSQLQLALLFHLGHFGAHASLRDSAVILRTGNSPSSSVPVPAGAAPTLSPVCIELLGLSGPEKARQAPFPPRGQGFRAEGHRAEGPGEWVSDHTHSSHSCFLPGVPMEVRVAELWVG